MDSVDPTPQDSEDSVIRYSWVDIHRFVDDMLSNLMLDLRQTGVYGIPTGGGVVAAILCSKFSNATPERVVPLDTPRPGCVIVDDIVDSGRTMGRFFSRGGHTCRALFSKPHSPSELCYGSRLVTQYIQFPWEHSGSPDDAVVRLLEYIGEDPTRDGLLDTPRRVTQALREMTSGLHQDPVKILSRSFECESDEMVVVRGIPFWSLCEHHLMPFYGTVDVGYIPTGKVVGLSKIPRAVGCLARRPQIQERMTTEIATSIFTATGLSPAGVGVVVRATHTCMCARGVRSHGNMVTSCLLGCIRDNEATRGEFLSLTRNGPN